MTTHRRYYFEHPGAWDRDDAYTIILGRLRDACERNWWFNEPLVQGQPFGRLTFEFTASGRDQWWCHVRAMNLAKLCYRAIGMADRDVPEPLWEPLERDGGRYRVPVTPQDAEEG